MMRSDLSRRKLLAGSALFSAALMLAGCNETANSFDANAAPRARAPGVPVALVSLDGAPENLTSRLSSAISQQAARREISIVGIDDRPRYQVRGYVSAQPAAENKGELAWAFDIFDAKLTRARRVSGVETVSGSGDIWSAVTDSDLQKIAFRSLDEIAEFLAATPEAVAVRTGGALPAAPAKAAIRAAPRATSLIADSSIVP
ncbi:MAG: hypothetical protein ACKVON_07680 [Beijerinckiaceae bacterium]